MLKNSRTSQRNYTKDTICSIKLSSNWVVKKMMVLFRMWHWNSWHKKQHTLCARLSVRGFAYISLLVLNQWRLLAMWENWASASYINVVMSTNPGSVEWEPIFGDWKLGSFPFPSWSSDILHGALQHPLNLYKNSDAWSLVPRLLPLFITTCCWWKAKCPLAIEMNYVTWPNVSSFLPFSTSEIMFITSHLVCQFSLFWGDSKYVISQKAFWSLQITHFNSAPNVDCLA